MSIESTDELRQALACYATGVAIVTAVTAAGKPIGMTINSFASVSLEPPMVLWSVGRHAPEYTEFIAARFSAIHFLAQSQVELSNRFANPEADKFAGLDWVASANSAPLLSACPVCLLCEAETSVTGGDHQILISNVRSVSHQSDSAPLIFHGSGYRALGEVLDSGWD